MTLTENLEDAIERDVYSWGVEEENSEELGVGHYFNLLGHLAIYNEEAQYALYRFSGDVFRAFSGNATNNEFDYWSYGYNKRSLMFALLNANMLYSLFLIGDYIEWEYCQDIKELYEEAIKKQLEERAIALIDTLK